MRRPCGTKPTPLREITSGVSRVTGSPNTRMSPSRGGHESDDRAHASRLARAVASEQREHAPGLKRKRHIMQYVAVAIERVDAVQSEALQSPR